MTEFVRPFRMGDVVMLARPSSEETYDEMTFALGLNHVIHDVKYDGESFNYSTDHGAWFEHAQFDLVRECDAESMAVLRQAMIDEGEIDADDDEEGMTEEEEETATKLGAEVRGYGQAAFLQGLDVRDNPYECPSGNWRMWREGFVAESDKKAAGNATS